MNISHPLKKFGNLDLTHWKGSDGAPYFNSTATIFEDLGRQKELVQIYQQASPSDTTCSHLYFQSTLDLCKAMTGIVKSPFARVFVDGFLRGADHVPGKLLFQRECHFKVLNRPQDAQHRKAFTRRRTSHSTRCFSFR